MKSNLWRIKKDLPEGSRIFEIKASIRFASGDFFKKSLIKLADKSQSLLPGKVKLDIFWQRETLVVRNRLIIRKFIETLKNNNINTDVRLPLCLPGWKEYKRIKKLTLLNNCNNCILKKTKACCGLVPTYNQNLILFDLPVKDFSEVTLKDFFSSKNKEPITWWIPRRLDIERLVKLAEILNQEDDLPCILDVGAGNGFLSYLLVKTERVKVIGIEPNKRLIEKTRFKHKNMKLIARKIESFVPDKRINIVINSFMPYKLGFSPLIKKTIRPKAFVYIQDKKMTEEKNYIYMNLEADERKNRFDYKIDKRLSFDPNDGYKGAFKWNVYSSTNADREKITSFDCEIEVQLKKDIGNINKDSIFNVNHKEGYKWEKEISQKKI